MIPVKIQCGCRQRYAFDVEPVNGHMPTTVACPACGADGTAAANECIALALAASPAPPPAVSLRLTNPTAAQITSAPPPVPPAARRQATMESRLQSAAPQKVKPGKDGWATEESDLNKLGVYITVGPAIVAALISWGMFGIEVPAMILFIVVGVSGLVGGVLNIAGRGPIVAGAAVGLLIALGGYGAVFGWIHGRESVYKIEVCLAFALGAAPGFGLQYAIQRILKRRAQSQE